MATAFVQVARASAEGVGAGSISANFATNITAGSTIAIFTYNWSQSVDSNISVASTGETVTLVDGTDLNGGAWTWQSWYIKNAAGGHTDVTMSYTHSINYSRMFIVEVSGVDADPLNAHASEVRTGTWGTGTDGIAIPITPTVDGCIIVAAAFTGYDAVAINVGTGWTNADGATWGVGNSGRVEYKVQATAALINATFTYAGGSASESKMAMAFKPAAAPYLDPVVWPATVAVRKELKQIQSVSVTDVGTGTIAAAQPGNLLLLLYRNGATGNDPIVSISDNISAGWQSIQTIPWVGTSVMSGAWFKFARGGETLIDWVHTANSIRGVITEWQGVPPQSPRSSRFAFTPNGVPSTSIDSGSIQINTNEFVVGHVSIGGSAEGTVVLGAGWKLDANSEARVRVGYSVNHKPGDVRSFTATTASTEYGAGIISFKLWPSDRIAPVRVRRTSKPLTIQTLSRDATNVGTFDTPITAGNLLIATIRVGGGGDVTAVTDSVNGPWKRAHTYHQTTDNFDLSVWYRAGAQRGTTAITITAVGSPVRFVLREINGCGPNAYPWATMGAQADSGDALVGPLRLGEGLLVIGSSGGANGYLSPPSPWDNTAIGKVTQSIRSLTGLGSVTYTATGDSVWAASLVLFDTDQVQTVPMPLRKPETRSARIVRPPKPTNISRYFWDKETVTRPMRTPWNSTGGVYQVSSSYVTKTQTGDTFLASNELGVLTDQFSEWTIGYGGDADGGPACRCVLNNAGDSGYWYNGYSGYGLSKLTNGGFNALGSAQPYPVPVTGDRVRVEAIGSLIRGYINGKLVQEATDIYMTKGYPGVMLFSAGSMEVKNFEGGGFPQQRVFKDSSPLLTRTPSTKNIVASRKPIKTSGVRINQAVSTAIITRSSNLPTSTDFTMCAWVRVVVDRTGNYRYALLVENTVPFSVSSASYTLGWNSSNGYEIATGGPAFNFSPDPPVNGTWFFTCMSAVGLVITGRIALRDSQFQSGSSTSGASFTTASFSFGNNSWNEVVGCEFAHMRVWKRALSEVELYAEMNSPFAVSKNALDTDILGYNDRRNRAPGGEWTYASVSGGTQELILSNSLDIRILNKFVIPVSTGLTVTSIVPSILYKGLTNIVITGTDFGSTQGTSQVLLDGVPQTIVDWTNTSIIFSVTSPTEWANPRVLQVARVRS